MQKDAILLVNFGGPRNLGEVYPFLKALLLDQDVIRTSLPFFLHRLIFGRVAKKRSVKIAKDYALIGGKSPIFDDTESIASRLGEQLGREVVTFHRYLPMTHEETFQKIEEGNTTRWIVVPLFPQFSYATTGSIARYLSEKLCGKTNRKLHWIRSYANHPLYIKSMKQCIDDFLRENHLKEEEIALLFSAHGLPQQFICQGDPYERECLETFRSLKSSYPQALCKLSFQSKFGRGEWLRPYTDEVCEDVKKWSQGRKSVCIVPMSFTSDHIETLYEIEELYVSKIREKGLNAYRIPALGLREDWITTLGKIIEETHDYTTSWMLIRPEIKACCNLNGCCACSTNKKSCCLLTKTKDQEEAFANFSTTCSKESSHCSEVASCLSRTVPLDNSPSSAKSK